MPCSKDFDYTPGDSKSTVSVGKATKNDEDRFISVHGELLPQPFCGNPFQLAGGGYSRIHLEEESLFEERKKFEKK